MQLINQRVYLRDALLLPFQCRRYNLSLAIGDGIQFGFWSIVLLQHHHPVVILLCSESCEEQLSGGRESFTVVLYNLAVWPCNAAGALESWRWKQLNSGTLLPKSTLSKLNDSLYHNCILNDVIDFSLTSVSRTSFFFQRDVIPSPPNLNSYRVKILKLWPSSCRIITKLHLPFDKVFGFLSPRSRNLYF